jgi:hypothetical protein
VGRAESSGASPSHHAAPVPDISEFFLTLHQSKGASLSDQRQRPQSYVRDSQKLTSGELLLLAQSGHSCPSGVDHFVVLSEAHLRRIQRTYASYYNEIRTHRSLDKDAPVSRPVQSTGNIKSHPTLGGLHHHYVRV